MSEIFTIGFGQKSLKKFIQLLKKAGVTKVIDVRLNNTSQLSGFAKRDDLQYILDLVGIEYLHELSLAPDKQLLDDYKKKKIDWKIYQDRYINSLSEKMIPNTISDSILNGKVCFLCSEHKPDQCHRRLLAEFIKQASIQGLEIKHLY
jgi:Uncharacterized conserved protein